jgi:hypothetical protein
MRAVMNSWGAVIARLVGPRIAASYSNAIRCLSRATSCFPTFTKIRYDTVAFHENICYRPIRPAREIYNAKPSQLPRVRVIHNAKAPGSLVRTVEGSSVRDAVVLCAF